VNVTTGCDGNVVDVAGAVVDVGTSDVGEVVVGVGGTVVGAVVAVVVDGGVVVEVVEVVGDDVVEVDGAAVVAVVVLTSVVVDAPDTAVDALGIASAPTAAPANRSRRRRRSRTRAPVGDAIALSPTITTPSRFRTCTRLPCHRTQTGRVRPEPITGSRRDLWPRIRRVTPPQMPNPIRPWGGA
jgi:hypothetical protein